VIKMTSGATKHDVFQAIADPTRRALLSLLAEQEMPVNMICSHFPMTRTAVSKHLKILEEAGLLTETKKGRETRYKLQPGGLKELKVWMSYYERFWDNKLAALKKFVENKEE
jgi:DNA-binding transcriptional ArsR family regulator